MSKINKVVVKGVSYDIEDKNEVTRAKEAEAELLKRIQGTSEKSDSRFDPFKDLGNFSSADEFNAVLDKLTYNRDIVGYGYGFFRATLAYRNIEIKNTLLSSGENVIIQVLSGVVRVVEGVITATGEKHNVLFRKHTATDGWSAWSESNLSDEDKAKLDKAQLVENISWGEGNNLDNYTTEGVYSISGNRNSSDNMPILNSGKISARLTVLKTQEGNNTVITQVLNLNNLGGGEGNMYIRSQQNGTWKPWGKLQTNVEVGQITPEGMSNLTDNGIYSGVCVDGTTVETFVLIVINNYLAATQAGLGAYVSQLKYSIDLNRGNTVKTRTRDAYGFWTDWESLGNKELATNAPNLALRALYLAAGAEYNESGADKTKTAPWDETVTHKAGHYYLNGLGDITEEQMMTIYNAGKMTTTTPVALYRQANGRTTIPAILSGGEGESVNIYYMCSYAQRMEVFMATIGKSLTTSRIAQAFDNCTKLKYIVPILNIDSITESYNIANAFKACRELVLCKLYGLKISTSFRDSPLLSKESILYTIQNAAPKSAITITLHHDAYVRLTSTQEVLDALTAKNEALVAEGKSGKVSLVCATHSEEITPNA